MNETSFNSESSDRSDDQQVIAEYYASRTYELTKSPPKRFRRPTQRPVWPDRVLSPETSFGVGLFGLALVLIGFAAVAPVLHQMVFWLMDAGNDFVVHAVLHQTMIYPAIIGFVFATVTPMFWYGSVMIRFLLAAMLVLPGCVAFFAASVSYGGMEGYWVIVLAMFCVVAGVPVLVQLTSQWTLSHSRFDLASTNPVGTRNIMELTIISAIACAVFLNVDTTEFIESLLFFMVLATLCSVAAIGILIAFLRLGRRRLMAGSVAVLFALAASFVYSGMLAFLEFGWAALPQKLAAIAVPAIYGAVVLISLMRVYVWWLRNCGWACINKADERQARESESSEPWRYWFELDKSE